MESSCYHVNIPKNKEEKNQSTHFSFLANELQMALWWCSYFVSSTKMKIFEFNSLKKGGLWRAQQTTINACKQVNLK
jgi:hypothetical protein